MSRGGRQKFGVEFVDPHQAQQVWNKLPLGNTYPVWVVLMPTSIKVMAKTNESALARAYDAEMVGVYDMTIPLRDFMDDVRCAAKVLMTRSGKLAA